MIALNNMFTYAIYNLFIYINGVNKEIALY